MAVNNTADAVGKSSLQGLLTYAVGTTLNYVLTGVPDIVIKAVKTKKNLTGYQYQLLLREFVFNGFEKFMGVKKSDVGVSSRI